MRAKVLAIVCGSCMAALAAPFVMDHEGLRLTGYADPVGVPTDCYGHTATAKIGVRRTLAECQELLKQDL